LTNITDPSIMPLSHHQRDYRNALSYLYMIKRLFADLKKYGWPCHG